MATNHPKPLPTPKPRATRTGGNQTKVKGEEEARTPGQKILAREAAHAESGQLSEADQVIRGKK